MSFDGVYSEINEQLLLKVSGVPTKLHVDRLQFLGIGDRLKPGRRILFHVSDTDTIRKVAEVCAVPKGITNILLDRQCVDDVTPIKESNLFRGDLLPHQIRSLQFSTQRKRCMLALDMGLGKTVIGIAYSTIYLPALIVVPVCVADSWKDHIEAFTQRQCLVGIDQLPVPDNTSSYICLMTYSQLKNTIMDTIQHAGFACLVADEAHYLKNPGSGRSTKFRELCSIIPRSLFLTGTPAQKHKDIYHLLHLMDPMSFPAFHRNEPHSYPKNIQSSPARWYFADRYCVPEQVWICGNINRYKFNTNRNTDELRYVCQRFVLRMLKEDVLQLPGLRRRRLSITKLDAENRRFYREKWDEIEDIREQRGSLFADAAMLKLCKETAVRKTPHACKFLGEELSHNVDKTIIFFYHREVGELYHTWMKDNGIEHIYIDGSVTPKKRIESIKYWRESCECHVGLLSLCTTSTGVNLQFCCTMYCVELTFHTIHHTQSEARVYRIGQTRPVRVIYLVLDGSTDDMLWAFFENRKQTTREMFGDPIPTTKRRRHHKQIDKDVIVPIDTKSSM